MVPSAPVNSMTITVDLLVPLVRAMVQVCASCRSTCRKFSFTGETKAENRSGCNDVVLHRPKDAIRSTPRKARGFRALQALAQERMPSEMAKPLECAASPRTRFEVSDF